MKISRLRIGGFGSFSSGIDVDFGDENLSIVIGRNEAGKSTLMSATFGILFGFKDGALQKKFEPWEKHDEYAGEVEVITDDGRRVVVKRDFTDNTAEIGEYAADGTYRPLFLGSANPRGHTDEDIEYYKRLEEIVGFQDEAIFRGTVFMGQSALHTSITDQVRRLVSGSNATDFKGVLHDLHYRFSELTMENPWRKSSKSKPREIEILRDDIQTRVTRLEKARATFMKSMTLEQELKRLEKSQEDSRAALEDNRRTLAYFERFLKLVKDRDAARARFADASKRRDTYLELKERIGGIDEEIKAELRRFVKIGDDFPDLVGQLKGHLRELTPEEESLERERRTLRELKPIPNNRLGVVLAIVGVVIGASLLLQGQALFGVAAAVLLGGVLFFVGRMLGTGYKERLAELSASVNAKERAVAAREAAIQAVMTRSGGLLEKDDPDKVLNQYRRCKTLLEERSRKISGMTVLGEWAEIDATFQRVAEDQLRCNGLMEIILKDAPYLAELAEDPVEIARNMEELKRRIDELAQRIEATTEVVTQARIEIAKISMDVEPDLPALEDDVATMRRRLDRLELDRDALRIVIDTLEECVNEFQEGDLNNLSEEVSDVFREITANRYTRVTLSANMEPMLTKFDSTHIAPNDLSQGTQDQLYFAMRLAIARHLSRSVSLPFFLDDPFVNFDADRLETTRDMLAKMGEHQVIMVTCDRDYERWSENVLDLDRARAEAEASGQSRISLTRRPLAS